MPRTSSAPTTAVLVLVVAVCMLLGCTTTAEAMILTTRTKQVHVAMNLSNSPRRVVVLLDGVNAPITVANFVDLVNNHVYDGTVFFRVVNDFVAQGGDPAKRIDDYSDSPGTPLDPETGRVRAIPLEIRAQNEPLPEYRAPIDPEKEPVLRHTMGAIAMARTSDPNSASTQFYFVTAHSSEKTSHLDGKYAVFGHVVENIDAVLAIKKGDFIEQITVLPPGCELVPYVPPTRRDLERIQKSYEESLRNPKKKNNEDEDDAENENENENEDNSLAADDDSVETTKSSADDNQTNDNDNNQPNDNNDNDNDNDTATTHGQAVNSNSEAHSYSKRYSDAGKAVSAAIDELDDN